MSLEDAPPGMLRVGRFQAGLWADLAEVGEVTGAAAAWQAALRAILEHGRAGPAAGRAAGRPCARTRRKGCAGWPRGHDHGLGGILADDMGLGKTVRRWR